MEPMKYQYEYVPQMQVLLILALISDFLAITDLIKLHFG